ncbi:MAG: ABC transporter ATP-binding protein [Terriglobales bacterium]
MPLLEVQSVSKSFEGFRALSEVSLSVEENAFCALVGPNGAGKSTLFNVITGRLQPDAGRVHFAERDITRVPTSRVIRHGIGISFQRAIPFQSMTVIDNVVLSILALDGRTRNPLRALRAYSDARSQAEQVLSWVGMSTMKHHLVTELPQGDLKRVDIAMALASNPRLLLLDEPLAGLSRGERAQMVAFIRDLLRSRGITLLFTEHDTEAVMQLADRITVLHRGKVLAEGTPEAVRNDNAVVEAFLGREQ